MHAPRLFGFALSSVALIVLLPSARGAAQDWQKTYPVSATPSLSVSVGDTAAEVRSCGDCREIRIHVAWNERPASDYTIVESQSGNHVNFELREKPRFGMHITGGRRSPHVTVETPRSIDLEGRAGDGSLAVSGLQGNLQLRTGDGSLDLSEVSGGIHVFSGDGSIRIHNASGSLETRSSDGSIRVDGRFSGVQMHSSDGSLDLTLAEGSKLTASSRVESSDGSVNIRLAKSVAADLEIHTGDGSINSKIPLVMEGYNSKEDSHHSLRGRINGGGVPFVVRTHDASVTITQP